MTVTKTGTAEHPWCVKIDIVPELQKTTGITNSDSEKLIDGYIKIAKKLCKNGSVQPTSFLSDGIVRCCFSNEDEAVQFDQVKNRAIEANSMVT